MSRALDLMGQVFSRLTVISRDKNDKHGNACWKCVCVCGGFIIVTGTRLLHGHTASCGCLRREVSARNTVHKIIPVGTRFGKLVVTKCLGIKKHARRYGCDCDCGNYISVSGTFLRGGRSKSCGCVRTTSLLLPPGQQAFNRVLQGYKRSAVDRGLEWSLTDDETLVLFTQPCYLCGAPPATISWSFNGIFTYNGLDRVDNILGYTPPNTRACCEFDNRRKGTLSVEEYLTGVGRTARYQGWVYMGQPYV